MAAILNFEVEEARRNIVDAARDMLDGHLSFIDGARKIIAFRQKAGIHDFDPDILPFVGVVSETDRFPIGDERQYWSEDALAGVQSQVERAESWARDFAAASCQRLIERLGG